VEPWSASDDLGAIRLLVQTARTFRDPLEMLDSVGHIHRGPVYPRFFQALVEQVSGRTHEWRPREIFVIAGLFADQEDAGALRSFAENCLSGVLPQIACATSRRAGAQFLNAVHRRRAIDRRRLCSHGFFDRFSLPS